MIEISASTSIEELAAIVSQALEKAGIVATLSGGGAVSFYTDNEYQSKDLDFVTSATRKALSQALTPLGFTANKNSREFRHPNTEWYVEFPSTPLGFGDRVFDQEQIPVLQTRYGPIRIITSTLSVMDRLAAYWYHNDSQCWDQAFMVARNQDVDWAFIYQWASDEGQEKMTIDKLVAKIG